MNHEHEIDAQSVSAEPLVQDKLVYRTPVLMAHGSLQRVTLATCSEDPDQSGCGGGILDP